VYMVHFTHYPASGKGAELRKALEERARAGNAAGTPHNLAMLVYGEEPAFVSTIRHESLAVAEEYNARNASDPSFQKYLNTLSVARGRPASSALYEQISATPRTGLAEYLLRRVFYANPGKAGELRALVEKRASTPSPGAVGKTVSAQVIGPDRPNVALTTFFPGLAALETYLKAQTSDPAVQAFATQVGSLGSGGNATLFHILVRMGAQ